MYDCIMSDHDSKCSDCQASLGRSVMGSIWNKNDFACANNNTSSGSSRQCQARLCRNCHGKHPLILRAASDENNEDPVAGTLMQYCKQCFHQASTIDFSKTYDIVQREATTTTATATPAAAAADENNGDNIVWVFVHGASGSRQMFRRHAKELKERFGHSSILLDLPGHASRLEIPLTLESSKETVESVLKECETWTKGKKMIYVGGSLGAYIGFYILDQLKDLFAGAALMDCGQNVGPGASFKARAGLVVLKWVGTNCSNATLMKLMLGEVQKSQADYYLIETAFGAGMFFEQAEAHVACLKQVDPADYIPNYPFPILFLNGSEDYRDSEEKWLDLCAKKDASELKVYQGGDHFFMHDKRFVMDILNRMEAFAKKL